MTHKQSAQFAALLACAALSTPLIAHADMTTTTRTVVTTMDAGAPRVRLNGQPLATSVPPQIRDGVTLVPMRDIFEALGATVVWIPETQEIRAHKDATDIWLQIGNHQARVARMPRTLREAPVLDRGSTLVPLRFVSEALGARVRWNGEARVVAIWTGEHRADEDRVPQDYHHPRDDRDNHFPRTDHLSSTPGHATNTDVRGSITIPVGAVIPVTLDQTLSSRDAHVGDKFSATVRSEKNGDSEFPPGTKLWGRVTEARPLTDGDPGVLGMEFTAAELPDGTRIGLQGDLISLDDQSVIQHNGRIMARDSTNKKTDLKAVGIGAGAGFIIGRVLGGNSIIATILGAGGGYLYSHNKDKGKGREAVIDKGSTLGVRLTQSVNYTDTSYYNERRPYLGNG